RSSANSCSATPNTTCRDCSASVYRPQYVVTLFIVAAPPRQPYDSNSAVRAPAWAAPTAAAVPAAPPPTTAMSYICALDGIGPSIGKTTSGRSPHSSRGVDRRPRRDSTSTPFEYSQVARRG